MAGADSSPCLKEYSSKLDERFESSNRDFGVQDMFEETVEA